MANTLYASFSDAGMAEKAAGALLDHGVRAEDLSLVQHESRSEISRTAAEGDLIAPSQEGELTGGTTDSPAIMGTGAYTEHATEVRSEEIASDNTVEMAKTGISTTTAADAGSAAVTGGAVGLGLGAVAAVASLLIPGVGIIVGGGALATAIGGLVGATGAGAAVGAVTGYLKDQGVEEHVARQYSEAVTGGGAILAVHVPSGDVDEPKARQLLEKYGAVNIGAYEMAERKSPYMA